MAFAEKEAAAKGDVPTKTPPIFRARVNTVATSIENKKAQLVMIAHDVDPIELKVFLPALCCKMGVLYCIFKQKASLEQLVHRKVCTTLSFTQEKTRVLWLSWQKKLRPNYNERYDKNCHHWEGNILVPKSVTPHCQVAKGKGQRTHH